VKENDKNTFMKVMDWFSILIFCSISAIWASYIFVYPLFITSATSLGWASVIIYTFITLMAIGVAAICIVNRMITLLVGLED